MLDLNSPKRIFLLGTAMCLLGILMVFNAPAWAQDVTTGQIRGVVTDASGGVVPNASVIVTNVLTNRVVQVETQGDGQYDVVSLLPGVYSITFQKQGFKTLVRSGIKLETSQVAGVNVTLELGSVATKLVVEGLAPLVQTETSEQSLEVEQKPILDLPNNTGDFYSLLALTPGVSVGQGGQQAGGEGSGGSNGISTSGSWANSQNWLLDGGFSKDPGVQGPDAMPPIENISELNMQVHDMSAQYGDGTASFNIIVKNGTNRFHGMAYEYVKNDKLNARNFFAEGVPPLRYNRFGGNVGGPIKKDKIFFFFGYMRMPTVTYSPSFSTVPTAQEKEGNFGALTGIPLYDPNSLTVVNGVPTRTALQGNIIPPGDINSIAAKTLAYIPLPNTAGSVGTGSAVGTTVNNFYLAGADPATTTQWNAKFDVNFTQRNRLQVSTLVSRSNSIGIQTPEPGIGNYSYYGHSYSMRAADVWTINDHLINELAGSFHYVVNRYGSSDEGQGYPAKIGMSGIPIDAFPFFEAQGAIPFWIGMAPSLDATVPAETKTITDNLTWIKGKNNFKAGFEFYRGNAPYSDTMSGQWTFNGIATRNPADSASTGLGMADFMYGAANSWYAGEEPMFSLRDSSVSFYALDDIKLRPNLSINVGMRLYEPRGWSEQYNRQANFSPTAIDPSNGMPGAVCYAGNPNSYPGCYESRSWPNSNFGPQPRIGFAWSPKPNWSVRGGYGIHDLFWGGLVQGYYMDLGWGQLGALETDDYMTPINYLSQGAPPIPVPTAASRTPSIADGIGGYMAWQPVNMPMALVQQFQMDVQHQFSNGLVLDVAYVGTRGNHMPYGHDANATPANEINEINNPAVNMENLRPYPQITYVFEASAIGWMNYNALQVSLKKHFSNGVYFLANYTWSKTMDTGTGMGWTSQQQVDSLQEANNPGANYGDARSDVPNVFNVSAIYDLPFGLGKKLINQGGIVNGIVGGWQLSSIIQLHSGVPETAEVGTGDYSGQNALASEWFANEIGNPRLSNPNVNEYFNTAAFVVPPSGTFGTAGRNTIIGPSWKSWDASLAKNFKMHWLGEAGNLQIRVDATDLTNNPNFGMPDNAIGTAGAGHIYYANTSRVIQLGGRLYF
jgi:hypothetical protein